MSLLLRSGPTPPPSPIEGKGPTLSATVRARLASEIVEGMIAPGMVLDETEIATRYGVSRTPVREAIRDLAATGLVEIRARRSAIVTRPSIERLRGMFEIMAELEALAASMAARDMTTPERAELSRIHLSLKSLAGEADAAPRYHEINERFHAAIYAGSHNDYLVEITLQTRMRLSPFRRAQFFNEGRLVQSFREHDAIVTAIMAADSGAAAEAMRRHIMTVEAAYEKFAARS